MLFGRHMSKYYLKYILFYLIGIVGLVLVDYYQLKIPEYLGDIVTAVEGSNDITVAAISVIIYGLVKVGIIMCLGRMLWRFALFNASGRIEASLRKEMFLKSERLSQRYYHENKVGSVMAWFTTDLETIEEFIGWGFVMLFDAIFLSVVVIIKMLKLNLVLSLISFIPLLLIIIWGGLVEKFMAMRWTNRQKEFDRLYDFTQENFTGIRVIKAFVKGTNEIHAFAKIARKNQDTNIDFVKISVLFDVIISLLIAAIMAIILGFGGWFAYSTAIGKEIVIFGQSVNLEAGELVTFLGYFESIVWPMMALGQIVSMLSRSSASLKRISHFLDEDEEIKNNPNSYKLEDIKGKITFKNYSFEYPGSKQHSLDNISFEINPGETIGVIGKIGSGKTTLVNSLLRLYNVEPNTIFIDDHDIMDCDINSVRESISYVPQDNFLFSDKIRNNIAFSNRGIDFARIKKAAQFADVDENISCFKEGYDTLSGERGVSLSGGQKQRISIARAYIKEAPIMIMDDSVSAVDVKTEENILKNIKENRNGKTTIVIASRVSTVSHLSRILVLNEGKIEAFDTPENLLKTSPTYQNMVRLQALEAEVEGGNH